MPSCATNHWARITISSWERGQYSPRSCSTDLSSLLPRRHIKQDNFSSPSHTNLRNRRSQSREKVVESSLTWKENTRRKPGSSRATSSWQQGIGLLHARQRSWKRKPEQNLRKPGRGRKPYFQRRRSAPLLVTGLWMDSPVTTHACPRNLASEIFTLTVTT